MKYVNVVFLQDEEGREVVDRLFTVEGVVAHGITSESLAEAFDYLQQWDYGDGEVIESDESPSGLDWIFRNGDYELSANLGLGYVGLIRYV